jgi:hypothetical protein
VERSLHISCGLYQLSCALHIYLTIGGKDAEHHACSARLTSILNVEEHSLELIVGIEEVTTTRAYHNAEVEVWNLGNTLYGCQ